MNKVAIAVGMSAILASVSPVLAFDTETTSQETKAISINQLTDQLNQLTDNELAAIEGGQGPVGQVGLVNLTAQNVLNNNDMICSII